MQNGYGQSIDVSHRFDRCNYADALPSLETVAKSFEPQVAQVVEVS
jgi:hypothetical protein